MSAGIRNVLSWRTGLVLVCGLAAVVAAVVAIGRLQAAATASHDAELQLTALRLDLSQIQDVPWGASPDEGDAVDEVRGELTGVEEEITGSLAALDLPESAAIEGPFERSVPALFAIITQLAAGRDASAPSRKAAHELAAADSALREVARGLHADSQGSLRAAQVGSAAVILLLFVAFAWFYLRVARVMAENRRLLDSSQGEALTDSLTGLGNRRALMADLDAAAEAGEVMLALFDLDGFKQYNDSFGHPAGDALLARLGARLAAALEGIGTAYRMGGDEFCIIAPVGVGEADGVGALAASALYEAGDGFDISCSYGVAALPADTRRPDVALVLADQRMYQHKAAGRTSPTRQSADVLVSVLSERNGVIGRSRSDVAELAGRTAERLGLSPADIDRIRLAAELHDVGKVAIPDAILEKPGRLDGAEWAFMKRHTVVGERVVRAAPALAPMAELIRWHHERHDGTGYPDLLRGEEIPIGARILAVADAFDAMVSGRPYQDAVDVAVALDELRRCAGTQFDPAVVAAFVAVASAPSGDRAAAPPA